VDDEQWRDIHVALNAAGVESMSAKWDEMFGLKEEVVEDNEGQEAAEKGSTKKVAKKRE